jgi:DNA-nicking Smr family endonuclease
VPGSPEPGRRASGRHADDHALWEAVARSVTPLKRRRVEVRSPTAVPDAGEVKPKSAAKPGRVARPGAKSVPVSPPPALAPLGRRTRQKLARGAQPIDARIDLHGLTQSEAHHALGRFLRHAQASGARFVLVITGKGVRPGDAGERGVLKRQVPMWLRLAEFRDCVVGFEAAHGGHGGEGALYVQVRRVR